MDIPLDESRRASTKFTFLKRDKIVKRHTDLCVIFPDELNEDCFVALSKQTSKVGWGMSREEAYLDLVIGIALAIKYAIDNNINAKIGVPSSKDIWDESNLSQLSRLDIDVQNELLQNAKVKIEGEAENPIAQMVGVEPIALSDTVVLEAVEV